MLAQCADELCVFGKLLHQNLPCPLQGRFGIRDSRVIALLSREGRLEKLQSFLFRSQRGVGEQGSSERIEARFTRNHCLGPPFRLVTNTQAFITWPGIWLCPARPQIG